MRVQLFNPSVWWYQGTHYRMNPPLGLPILASVLHQAGHEAEVVDLEAIQRTPAQLEEAFSRQPGAWPDVVGFTALTASSRGAQECIAAIRRAGYDGRIVVGGVHATLYPEVALGWGADLVVTGECEGNIVALLEDGATGVHRGLPAQIEDIPSPAWRHHAPSPSEYHGNSPHLIGRQGITMWSRGCPHNCIMCGNTIFHSKTRYRPIPNIVAELRELQAFNIQSLFVYDDELIGQRLPDGWAEGLAAHVGPLGFAWKCQGRASRRYIDEVTLRMFRRAGCRVIMWGLESFSQTTLNHMRKGTKVEDNWHSLRMAKQAGIDNWVFSMIGNYGEGEDEVRATQEALAQAYREGLVDYRQTTVVTALPGTPLWQRQHDEGWYVPAPETGPQMHQVYASTPWLSGERIAYWLQRIEDTCPAGAER